MKKNAINKLCSVEEVTQLIKDNKVLVLAGSEMLLQDLPEGNWIGGTIPYFMDTKGGTFSTEKIFVTDFTHLQHEIQIKSYGTNEISKIVTDRFNGGFTYLLVPAFSEMHQKYAIEIESVQGLYDTPIIGWITGIDLNKLGTDSPKVINGTNKEVNENKALALHIKLHENKMAQLEILNIFEQGSGDTIVFEEDGFSCKNCLVNGSPVNFAEYIAEKNIDIRLPLVADYSGAMINISFQNVDKEKKEVQFYAPVRKGLEYKLAAAVSDYVSEFQKIVPDQDASADIVTSCNCILNYLYSELENKKTGSMTGPITFGEIAYVLVNQTMVYLSVV